MKTFNYLRIVIFPIVLMIIIISCTKDNYSSNSNGNILLKKIKYRNYITEEFSYNTSNLISEVNSTSIWRKFYYNESNQLIKQEIAANQKMDNSSEQSHEFIDPNKVGIWMYYIYEYDNNGLLIRQLNYVPKDGNDELRSMFTFEYYDNNLISKMLLHSGNAEVTQFWTYQYDSNGNATEIDYYSYLSLQEGTGPKLISKGTYEFDSYLNPYKIFEKSGSPGFYKNLNNIIKIVSINYELVPGRADTSTSQISYEYNEESKYPTRVINGEEYIYE